MRNRELILPVALLCAATAHAQSSVNLYGVLDTGFGYSPNNYSGKQFLMSSGVNSSNRWGLRGTEDLGGGLSAIFRLESGFTSTTGALTNGGAEFGRWAYVGLKNQWGTVTLGRQNTVFNDGLSSFSAVGTWAAPGAGFGGHPGDMDNLGSANRVNSSIKYVSEYFGGMRLAGQYSVGGVAGDITQNQQYAFAAKYSQGNFRGGVAYQNVRNPNFSFFGGTPSSSLTANNISSLAIQGFASARTLQNLGAGVAVDVGDATIGALYTRTSFDHLGAVKVANLTKEQAAYSGSAVFNSYDVNVRYKLTPSFDVGVALAYTEGGYKNYVAHYAQVSLGADYFLSKLTDLYAFAFYQRAGGLMSNGAPAVAMIGSTHASGRNEFLYAVGIRHKF